MSDATRVKAVMATAALVSLLSTTAHAFQAPLCATITCTGNSGKPLLQINPGGLHHAEVVPIFWGSNWTQTQIASTVGMIQQVVNGAYLAGLGQYGSGGIQVGPAKMVPTVPLNSSGATPHCANGTSCFQVLGQCNDGSACGGNDVVAVINAQISAGTVPPPAQYIDVVYAVFVPSGYTSASANATYTNNGKTYSFLWNLGSDPLGFTHELVEAITQNVKVTNCGAANQIVDVCGCSSAREVQDGINMAAYWSQAKNECVIPEGWDGIWEYEGSPNNWSQIYSGTVRQVHAGGWGVVATDTAGNVLGYPATTRSWTTIGSTGAGTFGSQFAVGNTNIVRLSPAADSVSVSTGSGWTTIHGSRSAVYNGGRIVTTDFTGTEFSWLNSGDSWANIGKPGDQIVVTGTSRVYGIALDHTSVWMTPDNSTKWSQVGQASSELFGGITANPAGTPVASSKDIWMYQGSGTTWDRQNGPGTMFALAGSSGNVLYMLDSTRSSVQQSNNIGTTNPSWTTVGPGAGQLVGGGNKLYAVRNVVY
jgi:hypothetical protein